MNKYQKEFIGILKKYRKKRGLSQEKFPELCDVSTGTIGNIECGIAKPSFDLIIRMAEILGIHPAQLFSDSPVSKKQQMTSAEHTMLMAIYSKIKHNFMPPRDELMED